MYNYKRITLNANFLLDTDSYFCSLQRPLTNLELLERRHLLSTQSSIPFDNSLIASEIAKWYIKSTSNVLDFSSIVTKGSFIQNAIIRNSQDSNALEAQLQILAMITKNKAHRWKDESQSKPMKCFVAGSTKQVDLFFHL